MKYLITLLVVFVSFVSWGQNTVGMNIIEKVFQDEQCYDITLIATCHTDGGCEVKLQGKIVAFVSKGSVNKKIIIPRKCYPRTASKYQVHFPCENCRTDESECRKDGCTVTIEGRKKIDAEH